MIFGDDQIPQTPFEKAEAAQTAKRLDFFKKQIAAETTVDPVAAAKLATAKKRLDAAQARRSVFDTSPLAQQLKEPPKDNKTLYVVGALAIGVGGYFAWKKWWKK